MMKEEIMVSIICNAYNHERYIRDALEGFVMQKTSFSYEVLIHDDASTDSTADIIREYEARYPNLIKPIYQTENQYMKVSSINNEFQYPRAMGKYIAICEGDDYWTDPYKLQKQVYLLEKYPNVDMCAHTSSVLNAATGKIIEQKKISNSPGIIPVECIILGGGGFVSTASLVFRKSMLECVPKFRSILGLDYTLQINGALRGGMLYLPDDMSVYRSNVSASWTQRTKNSLNYQIVHRIRVLDMLKQLDIDTLGKYHNEIRRVAARVRAKLMLAEMKSFIL